MTHHKQQIKELIAVHKAIGEATRIMISVKDKMKHCKNTHGLKALRNLKKANIAAAEGLDDE